MRIVPNSLSRLALAVSMIALASPAFAQDAAADDGTLGDIVDTAQHRSENLQDVPLSVATLEGETLDVINSGGAALSGSGLRLQSPQAPRTEAISGRKGTRPVRRGKGFKPGGAANALRSSAEGASTFTPQKCDC